MAGHGDKRAAPAPPARAADRAAARRRMFLRRRLAAGAVLLLGLAGLAAGLTSGSTGEAPRRPAATGDAGAWLPAAARTPRVSRTQAAVHDAIAVQPAIARAGSQHKEIALTFDDGPSPYTDQILRELRDLDAQATFFHVGTMVRQLPNVEVELRESGRAEVGNHTESHAQLDKLSPADLNAEIVGGTQALIEAGARPTRLFRPPYGAADARVWKVTRRLGQLGVLWTVDSKDYTGITADQIVHNVLSAITPGAIVLMHDGGGVRAPTVAAVPRIIRALRKQGYRFVTVPELIADNPPPPGQKLPGDYAP